MGRRLPSGRAAAVKRLEETPPIETSAKEKRNPRAWARLFAIVKSDENTAHQKKGHDWGETAFRRFLLMRSLRLASGERVQRGTLLTLPI